MATPVELFSRVLTLLEQPDWPAARAFVAAHSELLTPGADAALDVVLNAARQARGPERRPVVEGLEQLRWALRHSRDVGVDRAFADAARERRYDVAALLPPDFGLMAALLMFVQCETWEQSRQVVELRSELLDPHTEAVLDGLIAGAEGQEEDSAAAVEMLRAHQQLLRVCRRVGVDAAFDELTQDAPVDPLREAITAFLASPTPRHAQRQLAEHPEVVSERGVAMLERLVEQAAPVVPTAVAETMRARLALLRRCTEIGVEAAFAEETGGRPHPSELDDLLVEAMSTGGQEDVAQLLRAHPDLLDDESGEVLGTLRAAAERDEDAEMLDALGFLEAMGSRARARPEGVPDPDELTVLTAVQAFVSADTWPSSRRVVDEHPELLGDVADQVLVRLEREAQADGQPEFAEMLGTHRRLLARCRDIGVREAFAELGRGGDDPSATEVERMLQESLDELTEAGAPEEARVQMRARTAYFLFERHQATGALDDLDVAVGCLQVIVRNVAVGDELTAHHQHFLGKLLTTRYARTRRPDDIAAAVDAFRRAVAALPSASSALPAALTDLAHAQLDLHKHTEEPEVLDDAVDTYRRVLDAEPDPVHLAGSLGNLAEALRTRLLRAWSAADEDAMVAAYRRGIEVAEPGSPMWFDLSNNLGVALQERSERRGDPVDAVADLDEAIRIFDTSLPLLRNDPAERAIQLGGRGNAWRRRHRHDQAADSINRAVADYGAAAAAAPAAADRGTHRLSLANALIDRFRLFGEPPDLDEAIEAYQSAITLLPQQDDRRAGVLTSLANAYSDRWDGSGHRPDLEAALETQEQAVAVTRRGSEDWPGHLSNLGNRYLARFNAAGDVADIDTAIRRQDDAVAATPATSDELPRHLNNLAVALRARYDLSGDPADLDRLVVAAGRAVMAAPAESPDLAGLLTTWGSGLMARYRRFARLPDLATANDALSRAYDAADTSPHNAVISSDLANALRARYDNTRDPVDLDETIRLHERALGMRLNRHELLLHRSGLANALSDRYDRDHDRQDLERAAELQRAVLGQLGPTAPQRAGYCTNLGGELVKLYDLDDPDGDPAVLAEALALCEEAVRLAPETSTQLPGQLVNLAHAQRRTGDAAAASASLREASRRAADTDPRTVLVASLVWGSWAGERQAWSEAAEAFGYGLDAVRRLVGAEASRADKEIWLRGTQRVATGLAAAKAMAGQLRDAVVALERGRAMLLTEMLHERADAERAAFVLDEPTFDDVARTAEDRPLVYLAAGEHGGHALVVRDGDVVHVRLDDLHEAVLRKQVADHMFVYELYRQDSTLHAVQWATSLATVTRWLWQAAVGPVLDALHGASEAVFVAGGLLGLLPLHAAWSPDSTAPTGRRYALDELTISYVPNARALHAARALATRTPAQRLLSVVDPRPVSAEPLEAAVSEALGFAAGVPGVLATTLQGEAALPLRFRLQAARADVLHLICHGTADLRQPLDSALLLAHNLPVRLRDLMTMSLNVRLAVLSACETGLVGIDLLEEVLALPTGMLQAGVAGVVASQWAVPDEPTAMLMTEFARRWAGGRSTPAAALRGAQRWLRDTTNAEKIAHWQHADLPYSIRDHYTTALAFEEPDDRRHADLTSWAAFATVGA